MASPQDQLRLAKQLLRREVLRQVLAPARILSVRLVLYYLPRYRGFDRPWFSTKNAIAALEDEGKIVPVQVGKAAWFHLPRVKDDKLEKAKAEKIPLYTAWTNALGRAGAHAEVLWRKAFEAEGWAVPTKNVHIRCPLPDDPHAGHKELHEIDVLAASPPYMVGCEVKNGPGEGWVSLDIPAYSELTKQQRSVRHHFGAMREVGLTPMLAAPFVDPSFYMFQARYDGIHTRYLFNVFAPSDTALAQEVKRVFRIGHVWAEEEPPPAFRKFVRMVPDAIERMREQTPYEPPEAEPEDFDDYEDPGYPDYPEQWP